VFVDSRLETYPIDFLRGVLVADADDASLATLIERWRPRWIVAEHPRESIRARVVHLLGAGWAPVHVDSEFIVLVHDEPSGAAYLGAHRIDLARAEPDDLAANPALRAQQRARFARLLRAVGAGAGADEQRAAAVRESGEDGARAFEAP
jgi:hypothetical protein